MVLEIFFSSLSGQGLIDLERELVKELRFIDYPRTPFGANEDYDSQDPVYDVAIIGGGMAGLTAAAALFMEGIYNVQLFDESPQGYEGPWMTYARMKTLRTEKNEMGPALGIPKLTFQAWYEAQFGEKSWEDLDKIPNVLWMNYLNWYRRFLNIPVENDSKLISLAYDEDHFLLELDRKGERRYVKAIKVILATGRGGFGGAFLPSFIQDLPKRSYAHVMENIDFAKLQNKVVGIIGCGASAFDAAATALEQGAKKVEMMMRAALLPSINKFPSFHSQCFGLGYYAMNDDWKQKIMGFALEGTVPPTLDSIKRVQNFRNFSLTPDLQICAAAIKGHDVFLTTNKGEKACDFLILATGYKVEGNRQPELKNFIESIALWKNHLTEGNASSKRLGFFPYLGSKFEFLEKIPGQAPYLKDLHCFNHASTLSQGAICRDITGISLGAKRLAEGIAADFLALLADDFLNSPQTIETEFDPNEWMVGQDKRT